MRIGVDTGGTFTDCVVVEKSGVRVLKVFTSSDDPARNILGGIAELLGDVARRPVILHGTTVGTNDLLERRGARVALVTTAGFEDLIEIGRQNRPELYNWNAQRKPPLVPRPLRLGVQERTASDGKILLKPSLRELARLRQAILRSGAESVAVCFLFSFANPRNEMLVAKVLQQLGLPVSVSHQILPEFREYERLSATVINGFLAPRLGRYLAALERELSQGARRGTGSLFVMQSSGGITTAARAAREPVRTILSGPAGGVVAARWLADVAGIRQAISFDMGGTSTDVCLLDGPARATNETTLAGLPVAVPVLDVHSVGAGGGSIARIDAGGALRVGPESAGATPGPICYGRGGEQLTVTDANLILGRLDPEGFLGGGFQLQRRAAEQGFQKFLRAERGESAELRGDFRSSVELALGIVAVSNATMEKALRLISVERGHDPRGFSLICFGGAGGLHAAELARSLDMKQVVVPTNPGALSAIGILISDIVRDVSQSVLLPVDSLTKRGDMAAELTRQFLKLERQGREELREDGVSDRHISVERRLDLRYAGQSYELPVAFTSRFLETFHGAHENAYGYKDTKRPVEIVNLRVRLSIPTPKPRIRRERARPARADAAVARISPVWFGGQVQETAFYDRDKLRPGMSFEGPGVVLEYSSTTLAPPGFVCRVDEYRNLILTAKHGRSH